MTENKRSGYALASTVALIFLMTVLLGVGISCLDYNFGVMEAYMGRFKARNDLESMTNLSLRWLSAEVRGGARPRAQSPEVLEYLTDFDSLRIFSSIEFDGGEVIIYDLEYDAEKISGAVDEFRVFPPSVPGGYMIRAVMEKKGLAPLTLESVYLMTHSMIPGGSVVEILDEKPVYWRELFRK